MLDLVIKGGLVVDGTGSEPVRADVAVEAGRIVAVGHVDESAAQTFEAGGLVISPGFVDPHTHYDAQLFWDPLATPSSWHGVTTVIGGNCGFTLAPLRERDADYTRRMMAQVEGMPLAALEQGVPWNWESFGEYLDGFEGRLAVNAGFMVGHSALRRYALGDDFARTATEEELSQLTRLLHESLGAGGLGLSTSRSTTHVDGDGAPVPSRWASEEELLALCDVVALHDGTSLELITEGCIGRFSDQESEFLAEMSRRANRAINWNVLAVGAADGERAEHQLGPSRRAREVGGRVVALTMPIFADQNMSFLTFCAMWLLPGWREVLDVEVSERIRRLRDPAVRSRMLEQAAGANLSRFADFATYRIGDVFSEVNEPYRNRLVNEIAAERGEDPFTTIVDIAAADDLRTVLWPLPTADSAEDWELRRRLWDEPDVMLGGSDAGAHLDRMLGSVYPTRFLGDVLRGRRLVSLQEAVHLMTDVPAQLFGLNDRGRLGPGYVADLVAFDPEAVDAQPTRSAHDLPGESKRLLAEAVGVEGVFVSGRAVVRNGVHTGDLPGQVLRSGRQAKGTQVRKD
ncbi:MAG: amidohydrolase family protein [Actinomycetota bacterium]|nr:amidohydrolase family protein [Actinomycetota bacterium]